MLRSEGRHGHAQQGGDRAAHRHPSVRTYGKVSVLEALHQRCERLQDAQEGGRKIRGDRHPAKRVHDVPRPHREDRGGVRRLAMVLADIDRDRHVPFLQQDGRHSHGHHRSGQGAGHHARRHTAIPRGHRGYVHPPVQDGSRQERHLPSGHARDQEGAREAHRRHRCRRRLALQPVLPS